MMKRAKIDREAQDEDRISELADELILQILCDLDMKSAAQNSILSKRWRYVWTNWTNLDFDPWIIIPDYDIYESEADSELTSTRYSNWVDGIVNAHHGPSIDQFRIFFHLGASYSNQIDAWLEFAISKRVKKLKIELFLCGPRYRLPAAFGSGVNSLRSLHLSMVNVSGELLESILLQCPRLEELSVFRSKDLVSFRVIDSCCKCRLKRLTLHCYYTSVVKVEINAGSLEYFEFYGSAASIQLMSAPSLVGACFGGECCDTPYRLFKRTACITDQLSLLTLDIKYFDLTFMTTFTIPVFRNVKRLTLRIDWGPAFSSFLLFLPFISACPVLCELKVEVIWSEWEFEEKAEASPLLDLDLFGLGVYQGQNIYSHLRVLEVFGFLGCDADVELILFLAVRAPNLKTLICDSHCYDDGRYPVELHTQHSWIPDMKETSRCRASKLAARLTSFSPRLNVIIQ